MSDLSKEVKDLLGVQRKVVCQTKEQAQAMTDFLWNEMARHIVDIAQIEDDLEQLVIKWGVVPSGKVEFVVP